MGNSPETACVAVALLVLCSPIHHGVRGQYVDTNPHIILQKDSRGVLPCAIDREVYGVFWNKGDTYATSANIIYLDKYNNIGHRSGAGYADGSFNITNENSLIIFDLQISDEGRYFCGMSDIATSKIFWNKTDVTLYAIPADKRPAINNCSLNSTMQNEKPCVIHATSALNISCAVSGYYPNITLDFYHISVKKHQIDSNEWTNADGTKGKIITITAVASTSPYVCEVSNLPDLSDDVYSAQVTVLQEIINEATFMTVSEMLDIEKNVPISIIVPCAVGSMLILIGAAAVVLFRRRSKRNYTNALQLDRRDSVSSTFEEQQELLQNWTKETKDWILPDEKQGGISCIGKLDNEHIVVAYENYGIDVLTIATGESTTILPDGKMRGIGLLPSGNLVICEGDKREVKILNMKEETVSKPFYRASPNSAISLCVTTSGSIVWGCATERLINEIDETGRQIRVFIETEIEPYHIFPLPNGDIGFTSGHFGERYAVELLQTSGKRKSVGKIKRHQCAFATCDAEGNLFVALISKAGIMSITKFTGDGDKIEDIVAGYKLTRKHRGIGWWITMVAMSPARLVVADEERICFYKKCL